MCRYGFEDCKHAECQQSPRLTDTHGSPSDTIHHRVLGQINQNEQINVDRTEILKKGDPRWKLK